jgi:hypothetical protein
LLITGTPQGLGIRVQRKNLLCTISVDYLHRNRFRTGSRRRAIHPPDNSDGYHQNGKYHHKQNLFFPIHFSFLPIKNKYETGL